MAQPCIVLYLDRERVEARDCTEIADTLLMMASAPEQVRAYAGKVEIVFDGYDSDPRELFEIPAVRASRRRFARKVPVLVSFLQQRGSDPVCHYGLSIANRCHP